MSAGVFLQAVVSGVANGAIYGLVALGFSLIYRLTRVYALAHGDVVVGSVLIGVLATLGTTPVAQSLGPAESVLFVAVALSSGVALGAVLYAVAVRPFVGVRAADTGAAAMGWVATSIGAGLVIRAGLAVAFPREANAVPDPLHLGTSVLALPGGGAVPVRVFWVMVIGLAAGLAVERYVVHTRLGKAMRAVADDPETAALMGIAPERVVLVAFALAGGLAALAGLLFAPAASIAAGAGVVLGLKGIAAALLGGLGSARGALLGGVGIGVAEALAVATPRLGARFDPLLALAAVIAVLGVRAWRTDRSTALAE